ncbi:NADPH-dependent FMN reductase [uncultured Bdellovibrio sp.]|uniref:NADPH-dependent FMN reductase n=1 Tax=Bdellovibrio sp. HCB-162 TaxID=3394234 RepID=UPI0025D4ECC6|nr:NAD(P)H-dependent oxidoreductase [uncultured Bdellovibrio sp.]
MNLLLFAGSLRQDSYNRKLLAVAKELLSEIPDITVTVADLKTLAFPVYDGDIEAAGMPESVKSLGQMIQAADGLVIASPEYNASISSPLKNAIDWVSRLRPVPFERKPVLLMGTSPGAFGSIRGLGYTRAPFETLGSFLYPQPFAVPKAAEAFSPTGDLVDPATKQKLKTVLQNYVYFAHSLSGK